MTATPRLLAFAGSLREGCCNRRLDLHMCEPVLAEGARTAGAQVTLIGLRDTPLLAYDAAIDAAGMPPPVRPLQQLMRAHDGVLIRTPEYNGSLPALLKNTLDWISRPTEDGSMGTVLFRGKVAGIVAASPDALGGLRALLMLRGALAKLGLVVVPQQVAIGQAAAWRAGVHGVGAAIVRLAAAQALALARAGAGAAARMPA